MLDATNGNLELAQKSVILLTEFDTPFKLCSYGVGIKKFFHELPEFMHGNSYKVSYKGKKIIFNTSYISFIGTLNSSKLEEDDCITVCHSEYMGFRQIIDVDNLEIEHLIEEQKNLNKKR